MFIWKNFQIITSMWDCGVLIRYDCYFEAHLNNLVYILRFLQLVLWFSGNYSEILTGTRSVMWKQKCREVYFFWGSGSIKIMLLEMLLKAKSEWMLPPHFLQLSKLRKIKCLYFWIRGHRRDIWQYCDSIFLCLKIISCENSTLP